MKSLAILLLLAVAVSHLHAARIEPLGFLPDRPGASHASAISADGSTVVGYCEVIENHAYSQRAFRWRNDTGMQDLGTVPHPTISTNDHNQSAAFAVSGDGSVIVGESNFQPVRWTAGTGMQLAHAIPQGESGAEALGISGDGSVLFTRVYGPGPSRSYTYTSGGGLVEIPGLQVLFGCSLDGNTAVGYSDSFSAIRWNRASGTLALGDFGPCANFHGSFGRAASADGRIVVGDSYPMFGSCSSFDEMFEAFRWTAAYGMKRLGGIDNNFISSAHAVSGDGKIVAGASYTPVPNWAERAVLWNESGQAFLLWDILAARGVDLSHWKELNAIHSISTNALFLAGHGINTNNVKEAFRVELDDLHFGPALALSMSAAGLSLTWPAFYSSMRLEFTESLAPPVTWHPVTNQIQSTAEQQTVTLQSPGVHHFYRLVQ